MTADRFPISVAVGVGVRTGLPLLSFDVPFHENRPYRLSLTVPGYWLNNW